MEDAGTGMNLSVSPKTSMNRTQKPAMISSMEVESTGK